MGVVTCACTSSFSGLRSILVTNVFGYSAVGTVKFNAGNNKKLVGKVRDGEGGAKVVFVREDSTTPFFCCFLVAKLSFVVAGAIIVIPSLLMEDENAFLQATREKRIYIFYVGFIVTIGATNVVDFAILL